MRLWIVMARWPGGDWQPESVWRQLVDAETAMRERFAGTVAERRVQPARLER